MSKTSSGVAHVRLISEAKQTAHLVMVNMQVCFIFNLCNLWVVSAYNCLDFILTCVYEFNIIVGILPKKFLGKLASSVNLRLVGKGNHFWEINNQEYFPYADMCYDVGNSKQKEAGTRSSLIGEPGARKISFHSFHLLEIRYKIKFNHFSFLQYESFGFILRRRHEWEIQTNNYN